MGADFQESIDKLREKALLDYEILDTESENTYNDITLLASHVAAAPISLISLFDRNRKWIKSKLGLTIGEVAFSGSFGSYAIQNPDEIFIVTDAQKDPRFVNNPLVIGEPRVRFYAGIPLCTSAGIAIGTLSVMDIIPRPRFTEESVNLLWSLAQLTMTHLETRRFVVGVSHELKKLHEMNIFSSETAREEYEAMNGKMDLVLQKIKIRKEQRLTRDSG